MDKYAVGIKKELEKLLASKKKKENKVEIQDMGTVDHNDLRSALNKMMPSSTIEEDKLYNKINQDFKSIAVGDLYDAWRSYIGSGYQDINSALRDNIDNKHANNLKQLDFNENFNFKTLYRGESFYTSDKDALAIFNKLKTGFTDGIYQFNQFVSTTLEPSIALDFAKVGNEHYFTIVYKFSLPDNYKAGVGNQNEMEIIFKDNSKIMINSIKSFQLEKYGNEVLFIEADLHP